MKMKMQLKRFYFVLMSLSLANIVLSEIDRSDKGHGDNRFHVVNTGRVETVLMWLRDIDLWACAETCVRHLRCVSFNYQHAMKWCEVTDRSFEVGWVDEVSPGWKNYATPDKMHGGFSKWSEFGGCSVVCGGVGKHIRRRFCNNPVPMFDGNDCNGKYVEEKECNNGDCPNLALFKQARQSNTLDPAELAVDRNLATKSVTKGTCAPNCWWSVDLGQNSTIQKVILHIGKLYLQRIKKHQNNPVVKMSEDEINWVDCRLINKEPEIEMQYTCKQNTNIARYVRIEFDKALFLYEVKVLGKYVE